MSDEPPENEAPDANGGAIQRAWSASSAVREFSGIHRTIRGLIRVLQPAVAASQPGDDRRTRVAAKAMAFAVEGTRFHHSLEDNDYWPALIANGADKSLLEPLMAEHHELDPVLDELDAQTGALAANLSDEPALSASKELFVALGDHLLPHLDHEEPIFFPLLAQYLPESEAHTLSVKAAKSAPRSGISWIMAGATYAMRPREGNEFLRALPKPVVWLRPMLLRRYRRDCATLGVDPTELSRVNGP
jgi:hemerythrin-like domain-containing protein